MKKDFETEYEVSTGEIHTNNHKNILKHVTAKVSAHTFDFGNVLGSLTFLWSPNRWDKSNALKIHNQYKEEKRGVAYDAGSQVKINILNPSALSFTRLRLLRC